MKTLLTINPHKLKKFIIVNEPLLRALVREQHRGKRRGRKRIAERWIIVAIAVVARMENITWRALPRMLEGCKFLIEEGWMRSIPSKSIFHTAWKSIGPKIMEQWVTAIGTDRGEFKDQD